MKITYETNFPPSIINAYSKTKVSLFMNTSRISPDTKSNAIVYKNLVNEIEAGLAQRGETKEFADLIKTLLDFQKDLSFWTSAKESLGILATADEMSIYRLNRSVEQHASVGGLFYIKPLLRHFQSVDEYYLLALSKDNFKVYEGNRYGFGLVEFDDGLEITMEEVLGGPDELNASYDPRLRNHQSTRDAARVDLRRYYQYIHSFIDKHLKVSVRRPLILVGTTEQIGMFRNIDDKDAILDKSINQSVDSLENGVGNLRELVWEILEPHFLEKTQTLEAAYEQAHHIGKSSSDIADIIIALKEGRVETLVLEADRIIENKFSTLADYSKDDDTLSILADLGLKDKVNVIVLPKKRMPNDSGAFALYRY